MKPFRELSRRGRLRRFRDLAKTALQFYALGEANLTLLRYFANTTYRIDLIGQTSMGSEEDPYLPGRYLLRILTSGDWDKALGEMTWLAALSGEGGLPVPAPVPALDGKLMLSVATPGIPDGRIVSLMRWIDGHPFTRRMQSTRAKAWGRMVGRLHAFAATWKPPVGFDRFVWDWEGLLGGRGMSCSVDELVSSMPTHLREPFQSISRDAREVMASLGQTPEAFGLIHTDMYPGNILFKDGEVFPIDFEDCGFGFWLWDIAVPLEAEPWTDGWRRRRDDFLEGYLPVHPLPDSQLKHLDLFLAIDYATSVLWATAFIRDDPSRQIEYEVWRDENGKKMLRYFERG